VNNAPTTVWKGRITRQGLRDLNYYGPKPAKDVPAASAETSGAAETEAETEAETAIPTSSDAAVETPDTSDKG
jgi:hypothetical protein